MISGIFLRIFGEIFQVLGEVVFVWVGGGIGLAFGVYGHILEASAPRTHLLLASASRRMNGVLMVS